MTLLSCLSVAHSGVNVSMNIRCVCMLLYFSCKYILLFTAPDVPLRNMNRLRDFLTLFFSLSKIIPLAVCLSLAGRVNVGSGVVLSRKLVFNILH